MGSKAEYSFLLAVSMLEREHQSNVLWAKRGLKDYEDSHK